MHFKSIGTFLAKPFGANAEKKVLSMKGQHISSGTLASTECKLSVDHITGHPVETSGAGMQRLASAVSQLQHECGGAYRQTKAFQMSQLSQNSHLFLNKMTTYDSVYM